MGGPIGEGLLPTAGVFVAVALFLGLVAYHEHIPSVNRLVTSRTTKRIGTFVLVGAVVSAAALSGVGGPASPVETVQAGYFDGCEFSDSLTLAIGASLGLSNQKCTFWSPDTDPQNLTDTDAYASGLVGLSTSETYLSTVENTQQDTRSVMWAKAKITIVNELNNNSTSQEAMDAANATVENYTATLQQNVLADYNARIQQAAYLSNATGGTTTGGNGNPSKVTRGTGDQTDYYSEPATYNFTLADGSVATAYALGVHADQSTTYQAAFVDSNQSWAGTQPDGLDPSSYNVNSWTTPQDIYVASANFDNFTLYMDTSRYNGALAEYRRQQSQVQDNIAQYVTAVYAAYNAGEIDSTDLALSDPTTIATQASTDYGSTGYYGLASAQLAALGMSGDTNASHVVNTTYSRQVVQNDSLVWQNESVQVTGTLFYTGEDSQNFTTGQTYDPDNLGGVVYMSVSEMENRNTGETVNSSGFVTLSENFTVTEATNVRTGESINTTTMETRNYTSTNATQLEQELQELRETRQFYEDQLADSSGGISFDFGGVETGVIIALLFVAFLATRD
jgi:hypothetical protein